MEYKQHHLLNWLKEHSCINITCLENESKVPTDSIRHFIKERRILSPEHLNNVSSFLAKYGFRPMDV